MTQNTKSFLYTISAVLLWSTVATAFKLTLEGMNYLQLLFYSSLASSIVLFVIVFLKNRDGLKTVFEFKYFSKNILLGLLNPFLYYLVLFKAYSLIPAQEAQPLNYTWPITIAIFSAIFLKQKLTGKILIGMLISFVGVIIIVTHGDLFSFKFHGSFGALLALGSSIIWASFWTLNLLDKRNDSVKLFSAFLFGTVIIFTYLILFDSFRLHSYKFIFGSTYVGLFEMGITFFLWMKGLQLSSNKAKTATLAYLSPFISMVFIAFILGENILPSSIIGLCFIVGGILFQHLHFNKAKNFSK
ncbi:MAG: DMT family transporter [Ignavibacteriae bacterium]|nr:DMT family transporter [Ignavibacteriota bacterium]